MRGGFTRNTLSGTVVLSVLLSACEVQFTPDVVPLELGTAPPESFSEQIPADQEQGELPFTSADAMTLCGNDLTWGDGAMGACLAPGGEAYYMWTNSDEVYLVPVNTTDPDQLGLFQAVIAREAALGRMQSEVRGGVWKILGLGLTVAGLPAACISLPLLGCVLDFVGVLVTGGLVADSGSTLVDVYQRFQSNSRQGGYYLCKIRGLTDNECREEAGIISGDLEGLSE